MAWNDLTLREKQLDRLIDGCGIKLNSTNSCVEKVARAIGETSSELGFVQQRIELRLKTALYSINQMRLFQILSRCLINLKRMMRNGAERAKSWALISNCDSLL